MQQSDNLYRLFLEEMRTLENFRTTYSGLRPGASLQREDPEVRRLIEAMAFFNARTRSVARRNILATRRRLFQQFFPFLLSPLPATGLLQATTTGRFAEPATLPKGSEVQIRAGESVKPAVFRTTADLRILPIHLRGAETVMRARGAGPRLILNFETPYPRNDEIGEVVLYLSQMNNYHASIHVMSALREHLQRSFACFEDRVTEDSSGPGCPLEFGLPKQREAPEAGETQHPLEQIRRFFHFPEEHLRLAFKVPSPPRNWKRFSLCLDLHPRWPKNLRVSAEAFRLAAVPVVNLRRETAEPILCDGMRERYPIRHGDKAQGFDLHSVLGVYEITDEGMVALRSGAFGGGHGSYEIETVTDEETGRRTRFLLLEFPEAFEEPKKVSMEAAWIQPWFSSLTSDRLDVKPRDRVISGVKWGIRGEMRPHFQSRLVEDTDALLRLVSLKHKGFLDLSDIRLLISAMGDIDNGHFRSFPGLLLDLEIRTVQQASVHGDGLKQVYQLRLQQHEATFAPVVNEALKQLCNLLEGWISGASVELEVSVVGSPDVRTYRPTVV
ncbi:MAG: type VI secretion system baseplate subunit TssF [Planctomycetota bacterium]